MSENTRPKRGLLICVSEADGETVQVIIDDIIRDGLDSVLWKRDCFVTSKDYDEKLFDDLEFNEKDLADFGYFILARLYAFKQRREL